MPGSDSTPDLPYGVSRSTATGWVAWIMLAAVMLVMLGTVHALTGLVALLRPQILAGGRSNLLLPIGLDALAWLHIALGAGAVVVGWTLLRGRRWAHATAIGYAGLTIFVNFAFIAVYPITAIGFAVITMYAVAAHGREMEDAYSGP
jgi:hypothetical protein